MRSARIASGQALRGGERRPHVAPSALAPSGHAGQLVKSWPSIPPTYGNEAFRERRIHVRQLSDALTSDDYFAAAGDDEVFARRTAELDFDLSDQVDRGDSG